jgi:hypothetical protein
MNKHVEGLGSGEVVVQGFLDLSEAGAVGAGSLVIEGGGHRCMRQVSKGQMGRWVSHWYWGGRWNSAGRGHRHPMEPLGAAEEVIAGKQRVTNCRVALWKLGVMQSERKRVLTSL